MAADGSVIIDVTISKDGIEKGFQMLKNEVGSVGNAARKSDGFQTVQNIYVLHDVKSMG